VSNILSRLSPYQIKLLGNISVGFHVTDPLLMRFFCICQVLKKNWEYNEEQVLYNILTEYGVPMKLVRLNEMCLNKTYSKVRIGRELSDMFHIPNGLKQDYLSPMVYNFVSEYAIRKVQENHMGLKLIGAHQFLVYADDVNLLGDNTDTIKRNSENYVAVSSPECTAKL
jgi:hypothetical protein